MVTKSTKFFHAYASSQQMRNKIFGVFNTVGVWEMRHEVIPKLFLEHFELFTSNKSQLRGDLFFGMHGRVIEGMNHELLEPFAKEEVKASLFSMYPLKSSGADGLPMAFF